MFFLSIFIQILSAEEATIEGKHILYIYMPESSFVHHCKGKIYDRNEDGDLDITKKPILKTIRGLLKGIFLNLFCHLPGK